jgi:hypothetical protein
VAFAVVFVLDFAVCAAAAGVAGAASAFSFSSSLLEESELSSTTSLA